MAKVNFSCHLHSSFHPMTTISKCWWLNELVESNLHVHWLFLTDCFSSASISCRSWGRLQCTLWVVSAWLFLILLFSIFSNNLSYSSCFKILYYKSFPFFLKPSASLRKSILCRFRPFFSQDYDEDDLGFFKRVILDQWDVNHDGKISKDELTMLLMQQSQLAKSEEEKYRKRKRSSIPFFK